MNSSHLLIAPDITERKRAAEALRASQLQLQQSQKLEAIGQLAGGVAHDFNNMLTAIIGYTDLSLRRVGLENPIRRNLEETKKAAERAASLVRQLLAFSRKQILEPKVLDLNEVVNDMYSEPGVGTVFKVYLPRIDDAAMTIDELPKETIAPRGSETVLLVEDEEVVRGLIRKILMQAGYTVLDAGSGMEAIRLGCAHPGPIDLLLTDVVMPEISGKEVAQCLMDLRPTIRILYMSGYTDEAIVQHGVLDASVEFIQKPFTWFGLTRKVRQVLDRNPGQYVAS